MASKTTMTMKKHIHYLLAAILLIIPAACNKPEVKPGSPVSGLLLVSVDGKYGYRDTSGNMVIKPCYPVKTGEYREGLAAIPETCNAGKIWGYIDASGQFAIKPKFRSAANFSENLAGVQIGEKWGFIDKNGEIIVEPEYLSVGQFSEGLAWVRFCGEYSGKYTCPYGYIDKQGTMVIAPFTSYAGPFSEGLAVVEVDGKYGYIDKEGKIVIQARFDYSAQIFSEGLARIRLNSKKYSYIDKTGKMIITEKFDACGKFSEGLAYAGVDGKFGFIDKTGAFVLPPSYDLILSDSIFKQGRVCVGMEDGEKQLFHYIDKTGKRISTSLYDWCGNFRDDFAAVHRNGERLYIDTHGKPIW